MDFDYSSLLGGSSKGGDSGKSSARSATNISGNRSGSGNSDNNMLLYAMAGLLALVLLAFVARK